MISKSLASLSAVAVCVLGVIFDGPAPEPRGAVEAAASAAPMPFAEREWTVDSGHSSVLFRVKHLQASNFYGRFDKVAGSFKIDPADLAGSFVRIEVVAESVNSNDPGRDRHLKSPDFFSVKEFPKLSFESEKIVKKGDDFEITGRLTMRGRTRPVSCVAEQTGSGIVVSKQLGPRTGFETSFTIKRSDFGMNKYVKEGLLGDEVKVIVSLEGMVDEGR